MAATVEVRELLASLESGERRKEALREVREFVMKYEKSHVRFCAAMVVSWKGEEEDKEGCRQLLQILGAGPAMAAINATVTTAQLSAARWLCGEVCYLLSPPQLSSLLFFECRRPLSIPHHLTPSQEALVGMLCRLPDVLSNRMGRELPMSLLPYHYFSALGHGLTECLQQVYRALKESEDCKLTFPAAVAGKAALLGHKGEVFSQLVPVLAGVAPTDPLWQRVARAFFARVPGNSLEAVIDELLCKTPPSLQPPTPLYSLLGDLPLTHPKGRFLFEHKLFLVKVPSSLAALFNLVGYLCSSDGLRELMRTSLQSSLEVWSDSSALRHMDSRQHLWISKLLVLGVTCLSDSHLAPVKPVLQRLVMSGIQTHIGSPLEDTRHIGMAVGETLMNRFNQSLPNSQRLCFDYQPSPEIQAVLQLARPVSEQEAELRSCDPCEDPTPTPPAPSSINADTFGEGMAQATAAEDDSDDDLVPYAMDFDPDSYKPLPPRYLRTLLQALISTSDPLQHETALTAAESLIRSNPPDLIEVCVELMKVLLHLSDTFALPEFTDCRLRAMTSLAVTCPSPSAQYLTGEFYAPNYSLRQRMDVLEVLSSAAQELATPFSAATPPPPVVRGLQSRSERPWEEVIQERLRAKTRIISKGPKVPRPTASPNRFAPVAGLFFFPLMAKYDHPLNTLDLLGQDSLLLGQLLHTLATIMHCATHTPHSPPMALALVDFVWALRYHPSQYVRQGVLFALGMVLAATPPHSLWSEADGALSEAVHWVKDVCENDADGHCRSLAQHTLALLSATVTEVQQ